MINRSWRYGILVNYLKQRESLHDYTRETMREAHEKCMPVMRHMFDLFPTDEDYAVIKDQYMYGSCYLVTPVLEAGLTQRRVYLPAGAQWREVYDGGLLPGVSGLSRPRRLKMPVNKTSRIAT